MGREQRRHQRYDVAGVEGSLVLSHDARILNMSLTGLLVETGSLLRVGKSYNLRVPQPTGELRFQAIVQWCHLVGTRRTAHGNEALYHAGIDFRGSLDDGARAILAFLEENVTVDVDRRIAGRFIPQHEMKARIDGEETFDVCRLSLSGLLVETPTPPAFETEIPLEIDTPHGTVRVSGRVRNLTERPAAAPQNDSTWLVGVEFVDLPPDVRKTLTRYIESLIV